MGGTLADRRTMYLLRVLLVIGLLHAASNTATAQLYRYFDESKGIWVLTNIPKGNGQAREEQAPAGEQAAAEPSYDSLIEKYSAAYGVDPDLVRAVIKVESNYDPLAVSPKGARGLMQLMPETARELGVRNIFDPEENIHGGIRYLSSLLGLFNNNLSLALAAYNAGHGAVQRFKGLPAYRETRDYVRKVLAHYGKNNHVVQQAAQRANNAQAPLQPTVTFYKYLDERGVWNLIGYSR